MLIPAINEALFQREFVLRKGWLGEGRRALSVGEGGLNKYSSGLNKDGKANQTRAGKLVEYRRHSRESRGWRTGEGAGGRNMQRGVEYC